MYETFLLSNLIELQELDNEIFKLISEKSDGTTVKELKTHEIEFKKLQAINKILKMNCNCILTQRII